MIGAIIGDIVGSRFEWDNHRSKDFDFLTHKCFFTDDSVMSLAVCDALMHCKPDYSDLSNITIESMQRIGRPYPHCGYGGPFIVGCIRTILTHIIATETEQQCVSADVAM